MMFSPLTACLCLVLNWAVIILELIGSQLISAFYASFDRMIPTSCVCCACNVKILGVKINCSISTLYPNLY